MNDYGDKSNLEQYQIGNEIGSDIGSKIGRGWPHYEEIVKFYAESYNDNKNVEDDILRGIVEAVSAKEFPPPIGVYGGNDVDIENQGIKNYNKNFDILKIYGEITKRLMKVIDEIFEEKIKKNEIDITGFEQIDRETVEKMTDEILAAAATQIDEVEDASLDKDKSHWSRYRLLRALVEVIVLHRLTTRQ